MKIDMWDVKYFFGEYWCILFCLVGIAAFGVAELLGLLPHQPEPPEGPPAPPPVTTEWQAPPPPGRVVPPLVPPLIQPYPGANW